MVICETERLILRDFNRADIDKRIEWETRDCEWKKWDAPWEWEIDPKKDHLKSFTDGLIEFADMIAQKKEEDIRYSFQIELKESGEYIGWISCYCIDDDCNYTDGDGKYAFGIDIPPVSCRGKGYGYEAFRAAIVYLTEHGLKEIYTQTWSGNERMIALAKKLGFAEFKRKSGIRIVNGEKYDAITYIYKQGIKQL